MMGRGRLSSKFMGGGALFSFSPWGGGPTPPAPLSPPLMMGVLNMFFGVAESISGGLFDDSIDP